MVIRIIFGIILIIVGIIAFFQGKNDSGIISLTIGLAMLIKGLYMQKKVGDEDND